MTDIETLRTILEEVRDDELRNKALDILVGIEATFVTYELPYLIDVLRHELSNMTDTSVFEFVRNKLPVVRDACSHYMTQHGNPSGSLRVVAIDAVALLDMFEATVFNRNFLSADDVTTLKSNLETWSKGRVNGVGKKCCSPITTCRKCGYSYLDPDSEANVSLKDDITGRHVWRCSSCDALREMCGSNVLENGRCMLHGGRKGTSLTFAEANTNLRLQYISGTRQEILAKVMQDPESALSNASDIYLLEVRMLELTQQLGTQQLQMNDVDTLSEIRDLSSDPDVIRLVDETIALLLNRDQDEKIWDAINAQASLLGKLRVGESTILRNTQTALSEAQKRKLAESLVSAVTIGVSDAVDKAMPLLMDGNRSKTDVRSTITNTLISAIRRQL